MDTNKLAPHQQRVIDEKSDLDEKLTKLLAFRETAIWDGLPSEEQSRLIRQSGAIKLYSDILGERIAAFVQGANHAD